jgi:acyl carrier protein
MSPFPRPEQPHCPVCGSTVLLELCDPAGARLCPRCGLLLDWFRQWLGRAHGPGRKRILLDSRLFEDLGFDSLDLVELGMELEDRFGVRVHLLDEEGAVRTVADLLRRIARRQDQKSEDS